MPDCASCAEKWPLGYPACTGLPFTVLTKVFTSCLICLYSRWLGVDEVSMFRRSTPLLIILAGMDECRVVGWKAPQVAVFEAHRPFKCCAAEVSCHHHLAVFRINSLSCCMKCSHSSTILCSWKIKGPCSIWKPLNLELCCCFSWGFCTSLETWFYNPSSFLVSSVPFRLQSIWLVSFLTTFAVDIIYGVGVGFIYSILTVVSRSQYGGRFLLGEAKNTDLYSELKRFEEVVQQVMFLKVCKHYLSSLDG